MEKINLTDIFEKVFGEDMLTLAEKIIDANIRKAEDDLYFAKYFLLDISRTNCTKEIKAQEEAVKIAEAELEELKNKKSEKLNMIRARFASKSEPEEETKEEEDNLDWGSEEDYEEVIKQRANIFSNELRSNAIFLKDDFKEFLVRFEGHQMAFECEFIDTLNDLPKEGTCEEFQRKAREATKHLKLCANELGREASVILGSLKQKIKDLEARLNKDSDL